MVLVVHKLQPFSKGRWRYVITVIHFCQKHRFNYSVFKRIKPQTPRESQQVLRGQHSSDLSLVLVFP